MWPNHRLLGPGADGNEGGIAKSRAFSRGNDAFSGGGANMFRMTGQSDQSNELPPAQKAAVSVNPVVNDSNTVEKPYSSREVDFDAPDAPGGLTGFFGSEQITPVPRVDSRRESTAPVIQSMIEDTNRTSTAFLNPTTEESMFASRVEKPQTQMVKAKMEAGGSVVPASEDVETPYSKVADPLAVKEQQAANAGELPKVDPLRDTAWQMMKHVEGGEPYRERNGQVSRWGLGYNKGEPVTEDINQAVDYFLAKKLSPEDRAFAEKLDPKGQISFLQLAIHRPAAARQFRAGVQLGSDVSGLPDKILSFHQNWLKQNDPSSFAKQNDRWNRIKKTLSFYDPNQTLVAGE